ncbi:MAG: DUF4157 domain-containing protein [Gammaproteobacteria bacterium]
MSTLTQTVLSNCSPQGQQQVRQAATMQAGSSADAARARHAIQESALASQQLKSADAIRQSPAAVAQARKHAGVFEPAQRREKTPNNTGLPDSLKSGVEQLSGMSLDNVRVHYNSSQPAQLDALAYAQGTDIHVAPGQEQHLPHEAWHVVQQAQGRVQPTAQLRAGGALNDDRGLEQEADAMGAKAAQLAQVQASETTPGRPATATEGVVQAIMSVAEFQALTPAGTFSPRKAVLAIDQSLNTYIQGRTAVNAQNLIAAIQHYIGGNHDGGRIAVANQLLTRARHELGLLQEIGDANAFLVDALIDQVGIGRIAQLTALAHDVTQAHAAILPGLITAVDPANINNLNTSTLVATITPAKADLLLQLIPAAGGIANRVALNNLIQATGAAHVDLLAPMITRSGGHTQMANLMNVINYRHPGRGDLAYDLANVAGGNAGTFARLAGEVPAFQQTGGPGATPALVTAAIGTYNAAIAPALRSAMQQVVTQATAAHTAATNLGVNAGLLNNVMNGANGIVAVQGIINAHNLAGTAPTGPEVARATALRGMICGAVHAQAAMRGTVITRHPFLLAMNAVDTAHNTVASAAAAPTVTRVNWDHFLTRHTAHYFNFGEIKPDNTQWDVAWGAGASNQLEAQFIAVLQGLAAAGNWLRPGIPLTNRPTPCGGTAQIAGLADAAPNTLVIGQFFPEANPGASIHDHNDATMRAIHKLL